MNRFGPTSKKRTSCLQRNTTARNLLIPQGPPSTRATTTSQRMVVKIELRAWRQWLMKMPKSLLLLKKLLH